MNTEKLMEKGSLWFPEAITAYARDYDFLYNLIYYFSIFMLVAVFGTAIYFAIKYRKTEKNQIPEKQVVLNIKLELTWTIIPLILVMILFAWGFRDFIRQSIIPEDSLEIKVLGQKWSWVFFYPDNGGQSSQLVVPVNKNVKLLMYSKDVLHSFFIPNFRIKRDVIPGQYTALWFNAEKVGEYQVFCAEYCGDGHSKMLAVIKVVEENKYQDFLKEMSDAQNIPPAELGKKSYTSYGCNACHSLDGSVSVGPSWQDLFGKSRKLSDGSVVVVDENYIRESITEPGKKIVQGFNNVMPSFSYLSDKQIDGVIEYIKSLSGKGLGENTATPVSSKAVAIEKKVQKKTQKKIKKKVKKKLVGDINSGAEIFNAQGCTACHSIDGTAILAPSVQGIFNHQVELANGDKVKADEKYLAESIVNPNTKIVKGFQPIMPTYSLSDKQIADLVAYIKSLK